MKKNQFVAITAMLCAVFFTTSCNNTAPATEETADKTATSTPQPADKPAPIAPAVFVPFKVMNVTHTVKDFAAWKTSYDAHDSMRLANGLTKLALCRDDANPNKVYVFLKMADVQKAKDFAANPSLKEAMQKGGVNSVPVFLYADVLRFEESPVEFKGRVRVGHKVKDFDAWLKVYDAEGKATRAANGLIDRSIGRDITEPNMIYITFAISDSAKVKARLNDPALKKIMTDAGVISTPVIDFYTSVD
jgi:quinol monooxygenase YgiN